MNGADSDPPVLVDEEVEDIIGGLIGSDSNLTLDYDDAAGTLTIGLDSDISPNAIDAESVSASDVLIAPKYPTRSDVPDKEGIYRVEDVDGEGNFGIIVREV